MFDESDKYQTAATSNRQLNNEEFSKNNMGFVMVRKSEVSPQKNVVWTMFIHEKNVMWPFDHQILGSTRENDDCPVKQWGMVGILLAKSIWLDFRARQLGFSL